MTNKKTTSKKMDASAIADEIGYLIESGAIKPGQHLGEQSLADRFGTSRGPVREALRILDARLQIEIRPNVGAMVVQHSIDQLAEIHDLRGALLATAAKWAVIRGTDDDLKAIDAQAKRVENASESGADSQAFLAETTEWRRLVVMAAKSERILVPYKMNGFGTVGSIWLNMRSTRAAMKSVAKDWRACTDALLARDGHKAAAIIQRVYDRHAKDLRRLADIQ